MDFNDFRLISELALKNIALRDNSIFKRAGAERCLTAKLSTYLDGLLETKGYTNLRADAELSCTLKFTSDCQAAVTFSNFIFSSEVGTWDFMFSKAPTLKLYRTAIPDVVIHDRLSSLGNVAVIEGKMEGCSDADRDEDFSKILASIFQLGYKHGMYVEFPKKHASTINATLFTKFGSYVGVDFITIKQSGESSSFYCAEQKRRLRQFEAKLSGAALLESFRSDVVNRVFSSAKSVAARVILDKLGEALQMFICEMIEAASRYNGKFELNVHAYIQSLNKGSEAERKCTAILTAIWNGFPDYDQAALTNSILQEAASLKKSIEYYAANLDEYYSMQDKVKAPVWLFATP